VIGDDDFDEVGSQMQYEALEGKKRGTVVRVHGHRVARRTRMQCQCAPSGGSC
jgi:hypothetical protein